MKILINANAVTKGDIDFTEFEKCGEVTYLLLRLSPPNYEKIRTTDEFKVTYGGAEANVAASLSNLLPEAEIRRAVCNGI